MPLGFVRLNEIKQRPNANVNFIKPLEGPDKDVALDFLSRIAAIAAPIMRSNYIGVMSLEEFEPNREFWGRNFNAGEVIQLVLKSPSTGRWLPFKFVQMVFMHELAHCIQMNHSRAFWQVRNAYSDELRDLWSKNYLGDGLWGRGFSLYDGQLAHDTLPSADGEMVANLCGGTYRGVGGKKKRKTKPDKPQLSYAAKKQRKIAKKFGTHGLALGNDEETRIKLEKGKKVKAKPRVAGSTRGRELRAAALLDRLEQSRAEEVKVEEEDSDTDDDSEYETLPDGQEILDTQGHRFIKVCEGEDHDHDAEAQREMAELVQVSNRPNGKPGTAQEVDQSAVARPHDGVLGDSRSATNRTNSESQDVKIRPPAPPKQNQDPKEVCSKPKSHPPPSRTVSTPDSTRAEDKSAIEMSSRETAIVPNSCPICSLSNANEALTCAACAHVLLPDKLPNHWRCKRPGCIESQYINTGDNGVCGICGSIKDIS